MNKSAILLPVLLLLVSSIIAQPESARWGKVLPEDLSMTVYEKDSSADALILSDVGSIAINLHNGARYNYRHHRRIKLLEETAFDQASIEIPIYTGEDDPEKLISLKAQLFLPDGSRQSVSKRLIFTEKTSENWSVKKFTFPNLEAGAIIEYRYEITSNRLLKLRDWNFQWDIPVRYSELVTEIPEWLEYVYLIEGLNEDTKKEVLENETIEVEGIGDEVQPFEGDAKIKIEKNRFTMTHVPAIQREPFMTCIDDYRPSVRFQLNSVKYPGRPVEKILQSWEETAKLLYADEQFGHQFTQKGNHQKLLEASLPLINGQESTRKKVEILYQYLSKEIDWNGGYAFQMEEPLDEAFEKKTTHSGGINMMLLTLLKAAGIEADPVLVSTRSHGRMFQRYPIVDQFNHLLVLAKIEDETILLDAGDRYRPMGFPRMEALNSYGWVVNEQKNYWTNIHTPRSSDKYKIICQLTTDGHMKGRMETTHEGYSSVIERTLLGTEANGTLWPERLGMNTTNAEIDSMKMGEQMDVSLPLETSFVFNRSEAAVVDGDRMYINPVFYTEFGKERFKLEKRDFPVDIPYPFKEQFVMQMEIPDGYEVAQLPSNKRVLIAENGGDFNFLCSQKGRQVQLISRIDIRKLKYQPEEYNDIKEFYEHVLEKFGEQIVLKKSAG